MPLLHKHVRMSAKKNSYVQGNNERKKVLNQPKSSFSFGRNSNRSEGETRKGIFFTFAHPFNIFHLGDYVVYVLRKENLLLALMM